MDANIGSSQGKSDTVDSQIKDRPDLTAQSERKIETVGASEKQVERKPDISIVPVDETQRKQLASIQEVLKHNIAILPERSFLSLLAKDKLELPPSEVKANIDGLRKELLADLEQEKASCKMSDGTVKCLGILKGHLETDEIPTVYRLLGSADLSIPLGGPIKLQIGNSNSPQRLAADVKAGRANVEVNFEPKSFRGTLEEMNRVGAWLMESRNTLKQVASAREIIAIRNLRDGLKFPAEWRIETKEDCAAAAFVMQKAQDAGRLVIALDNMSKNAEEPTILQQFVDPSSREELSGRVKSCPSFIKMSRDKNDTITGVSFDLPHHLNRSSSDWKRTLKELDEWVEKNRGPVDQVVAEWSRRGEKVACYENAVMAHGNVARTGKDGKPLTDKMGNPDAEIEQSERDLGDRFARFNFMQSRARNEAIVDPKTGNTSFRLTTSTSFYLNPSWSYLNLVGWQAAEPVVIADKVLRDGNDFMLARHSAGMIVPVQVKGLNSFTDEQELIYRAGQATQFTMDLAMVLSATSELAVGGRALMAAQSAEGTLGAAKGTLSALRQAETAALGAEKLAINAQVGKLTSLVNQFQASPALLRSFQSQLADKAVSQLFWGGAEMAAGTTGFTHSAGAHENPMLVGISQLRTGYFTLMIGSGALQVPLGAARSYLNIVPTPGHFDQLLALQQLRVPQVLQTSRELGHQGFFWSQFPLCGLIALDVYGQWKRADNAGKQEYGREVDAAHKGLTRWDTESSERSSALDVKMQLDTMRKRLPLTGEPAQAIDSIFQCTEALLMPVWVKEGRKPSDAEQQQWDAERRGFISETLAPNFLLSPEQIKKYELERIHSIDADTARFHPALTNEELSRLQTSNEKHWFDKDVQKASAFALLMLLRKPDGTFGTLDTTEQPKTVPQPEAPALIKSSDPTPLFRRDVQLQPWDAVRVRQKTIADRLNDLSTDPLGTLGKLGGMFDQLDEVITEDHIKPSDTRALARQEIKFDDLIQLFEADLLSNKIAVADVEKVMVSGDVLLGLGSSMHIYAATLEKVLEDGAVSTETRTKALRRLADIAFALRNIERGITDPDELVKYRARSIGCNSDDIFKYFTKIGSTPGDARFNREMKLSSLYFAYLSEAVIGDSDRERIGKLVLSGSVGELEKEALALSEAAYAAPASCTTVESWARKFNALTFLERQYLGMNLLSDDGKSNDIASIDAMSVESKDEKLESIAQELLLCAQARCTKSDVEQAQQPHAARVFMTLLNKLSLNKLLEGTTISGVQCSRLEHLDRSENQSRRTMSLGLRRHLLDCVKSPAPRDGIEFQRLVLSIMPSILNSSFAGSNQSALSEMKGEFNSTLVDALESVSKLSGNTARLQAAPTATETSSLVSLMKISPETRRLAVESLKRVGSVDVRTIGWFADPKNEKEPAVRLTACQLLKETFPLSSWHDLQHSILSRRIGKEVPETDPTVNAFLRQNYEPVGRQEIEERSEQIIDKAGMRISRPYVVDGKKSDIVFTELPMLKGDFRSENFGRVAQGAVGTNWRTWTNGLYAQCRDLRIDDQGESHFLVGPEILAYEEKEVQLNEWKVLKSQFNQRCQLAMGVKDSAVGGERQEVDKARMLLFEIAKRPTEEFLVISEKQQKRDKEQYSNVNVICTTAADIEALRFKAVDALANAYIAGPDSEKRVLRTYLQNILAKEVGSDKDQEFSIKLKTRALEALMAPRAVRIPRSDIQEDVSYNCRSDVAAALEQSLTWRSAPVELVKSFQQQALNAFSAGGITHDTRTVLTALATGQLLKMGRGSAEVVVDAAVSTRASNLLAQQDWRLLQFRSTLQRGISAAKPESLFDDAKDKLERFAQTERTADVRERGATEDIQADRIQSAAWDILAAARGRTVSASDDPLRTQLRTFLVSSPHDEIKAAASLALLDCSEIEEDVRAASKGIADVATSGSRLALRRDATERLLSLAKTDVVAEGFLQEAVSKQRQELDAGLKNTAMLICLKQLSGLNQTQAFKDAKKAFTSDNGNVDNAISLLQEFVSLKFSDDYGDRQIVRKALESYAANLYLGSEMKLAKEPQAAAGDLVKCLNILAAKPIGDVPNLNKIDDLRVGLEQQIYAKEDAESIASRGWLGAEAFHSMIDAFERSGKFENLGSHYLCYALKVSRHYKSHTMGNTAPEMIRHDVKSARIIQSAFDKGSDQVFNLSSQLPRKGKDAILQRNVQYSQWQAVVYQNAIDIADRSPRVSVVDRLALRKLQMESYSQSAGALLEHAELMEETYIGAAKPQRYAVSEAEARLKLSTQRRDELSKAGVEIEDELLVLQLLAHKTSAFRERLGTVPQLPAGVLRLPVPEKRAAN